jgi:DNA-binding NarL/FixJ family response regulator
MSLRPDTLRHPQHVVVAQAPDGAIDAFVDAVRRTSGIEAHIVDRLADISPSLLYRTEAFLIWYAHLQQTSDADMRLLLRMSRQATILILVTVETFPSAAGILKLGDGWLLVDLFADRIEEAITLSREGYSIVPMQIGNSFSLDRLRTQIATGLSPDEHKVLSALGSGNTNRQIAQLLGVTETRAKMLVRSTMHKMQFINRTEAAVFVARKRMNGQ